MFLLTYINYGILHATRSAWSLASKDLIVLYGFSEGTVSDMNATFLGFYAVGGFFISHLADHYPKRNLIALFYTCIAVVVITLGSFSFIQN